MSKTAVQCLPSVWLLASVSATLLPCSVTTGVVLGADLASIHPNTTSHRAVATEGQPEGAEVWAARLAAAVGAAAPCCLRPGTQSSVKSAQTPAALCDLFPLFLLKLLQWKHFSKVGRKEPRQLLRLSRPWSFQGMAGFRSGDGQLRGPVGHAAPFSDP